MLAVSQKTGNTEWNKGRSNVAIWMQCEYDSNNKWWEITPMLNQQNERKDGQFAMLDCLMELSPRREPLLQCG